MNALIKIPSSEFNEAIFKKIKSLIKSFDNAEITIAVSNNKSGSLSRNESKPEYWNRISKSITDIEHGKGISFTMDELEEYIQNIPM